jgi:hypothetical protein
MVRPTYEFSQGKPSFPVLPTLSFLGRWLLGCENFFVAASSGTPLLERWQCSLKNFSIHT